MEGVGRYVVELLFVTASIYGMAWVVARSKLLKFPREKVVAWGIPLLSDLVECVVCTSVWVAAATVFLLPYSGLELRICSGIDMLLWLGWIVTATWSLARVLGDAD